VVFNYKSNPTDLSHIEHGQESIPHVQNSEVQKLTCLPILVSG